MSMISGLFVFLMGLSAFAGNHFQALPPNLGLDESVEDYRRECGRVRITYVVLLEVSLGFNWERGTVDKAYYELLAGAQNDPKKFDRQQRLSELVHGEHICVMGRLVNSDQPIPGIIPDEVEGWSRTVETRR